MPESMPELPLKFEVVLFIDLCKSFTVLELKLIIIAVRVAECDTFCFDCYHYQTLERMKLMLDRKDALFLLRNHFRYECEDAED